MKQANQQGKHTKTEETTSNSKNNKEQTTPYTKKMETGRRRKTAFLLLKTYGRFLQKMNKITEKQQKTIGLRCPKAGTPTRKL